MALAKVDHRERTLKDDKNDPFKEQLNAVTKKLVCPTFLKNLTPSRLPSQATSETSASPGEQFSAFRSFPFHRHPQDHRISFACASNVLNRDPSPNGLSRKVEREEQEELSRLHCSVLWAWRTFSTSFSALVSMASERSFSTFSHGHQDLVLAVDFNFFGNRMVTASSDHRLKVWDRKDDDWSLVDSWRAHDAEIVDVKWNGPFMGEVLGSIGEDGAFKLWEEDVTEVQNSGRRFQLLTKHESETKVPFMSLDFKNIMHETWAALITRDGYLTIYEPVDYDNLKVWKVLVAKHVCQTPPRQEEVGFKVCFHHEKLPCYTAIMAGLDRRALSLAVAVMDTVIVYRTDKSHRFYVAAELKGARNIIRDVAWANGSMRGYDVIATASKDGAIRIYEIHTPVPTTSALPPPAPASSADSAVATMSQARPPRNQPSGIGAGLAGVTRANDVGMDSDQNPGRIKHEVKQVAELTQHHGAVWRISFNQTGDVLVSTGDDGTIRTWKRAVNNKWLEYAEVDAARDH